MHDTSQNSGRANPAQEYVLEAGLLSSGFNCILQLPTGSGKTWLAEQAIQDVLRSGRRAVYITPLRALASELLERWSQSFEEHKVGVFTGEFSSERRSYPVSFSDARLLIMTPERLDACTRHWRSHWSWIPEVDLVVVDELHLLGDPMRGPRLEGGLSRLRRLNPFLRVLGLSATLGNRAELADWLEAVEYTNSWRTVPLSWRVVNFRKAADKPALLVDTIQTSRANGGRSLVFVQSRRRAEELANVLRTHHVTANHHHAGLTREQRGAVEAAYRNGELDALVATGTLEMGLNLPVRQVVLYDLQHFDGTDFSPLPVNAVWQRGGRAGRPGLDECGEVVLFAPAWDRGACKQYLKGEFEPILSGLCSSQALGEQILAEVASGLCRTEQQLRRAFCQSLAAAQGTMPSVLDTVTTMREARMLTDVEADTGRASQPTLKATRLGRIASRQLLAPDTVLRVVAATMRDSGADLTFLDLLLVAASTSDCEPQLPADFEELDGLASELAHERSRLLDTTDTQVGIVLGLQGRQLLSVIKTALVARAWTRLGDDERTAQNFDCYPFEVRRLSESLVRILTALVAIHTRKASDDSEQVDRADDLAELPSLLEKSRALQHMVQYGINEEAVTLTFLHGLGGTIAKRLTAVGIQDIEDLALAEVDDVAAVSGVSRPRAVRWIDEAAELIRTRSARCLTEFGPTLAPHHDVAWPDGIDPYRLRRAIELTVERCTQHSFVVSGGLEPHWVRRDGSGTYGCDCADHAKGHQCKHVLAVRLQSNDREIVPLAKRLTRGSETGGALNLYELWFSTTTQDKRQWQT